MSGPKRGLLLTCAIAVTGCGGGAASGAGPVTVPAPVEATVAQAPAPPSPAEVSAQVRTARAACSTEATKQQLEVVDFVTFNRLDESNWDSTIRVRRKGRLVRIGCRYDLKAAMTYIYEPSAADGGNPWGAAGPPKGASMTKAESSAEPAKPELPKAEPPKAEPAKAKPAPPAPGANINLSAIADSAARSAVARTRDACLAEAARRKIAFDDFDAFRRVEGTRWEAMLLIKKGKGSSRSCQVDVSTGKATIK